MTRKRNAQLFALGVVGTIVVGASALLGFRPNAQAQAQTAAALAPPQCSCAKAYPLLGIGEAQITNCQCGVLQCVVVIAIKTGTSQTPALACVK